ncbi:unnamed protein product [Toxocara canis]|uniref:Major sperm protein n=1 Tax=Toxocara canis TaxID=6265 RepID=A0A183V555_TOXCA|nr:unnamed protein product [Toxocara canis]
MLTGTGTDSKGRVDCRSNGESRDNSSGTRSLLNNSNGRSENGDRRRNSSKIRKPHDSDDSSSSSDASKSTSSGSDSESSDSVAKSPNSRAYDVEPSTPIAIASLVVPSAEPIKPSKEYINISSLFVEPQKVTFTTQGGRSNHILINESNVRLAIKVRSSNNKYFRVNPVYLFLDSGTMNELEVLRLPGGNAGVDQLLLCYVVAKEEDTDVKALFNSATKQRWITITMTTKK